MVLIICGILYAQKDMRIRRLNDKGNRDRNLRLRLSSDFSISSFTERSCSTTFNRRSSACFLLLRAFFRNYAFDTLGHLVHQLCHTTCDRVVNPLTVTSDREL